MVRAAYNVPMTKCEGGGIVMSEANKELVRGYYRDVMNKGQGDTTIFDHYVSPDAILHNSYPSGPVDAQAWKDRVRIFTSSFSDVEIELGDVIAEGDKVVTQMIFRGTHTGEFLGIPATGKRVAADEIQIMRVVDGKIVERRSVLDMISLLAQLGATEIPESYRGSTIPGT